MAVRRVSCGAAADRDLAFALAVCDGGALLGWGCNDVGQLGTGDTEPRFEPVLVAIPAADDVPTVPAAAGASATVVVEAHCGGAFSALVTEAGAVLTAGTNESGQLGRAATAEGCLHFRPAVFAASQVGARRAAPNRSPPEVGALRPVPTAGPPHVLALACGLNFCVCVTADSRVFSWGCGSGGALGLGGTTKDMPVPTAVPSMERRGACGVAAGRNFAAVRTSGGQVWSFGDNRHWHKDTIRPADCPYAICERGAGGACVLSTAMRPPRSLLKVALQLRG